MRLLAIVLLGIGPIAFAAPTRSIQIKSAADTFDLQIHSRANGSVDGKPALLGSLSDLWPVFDNPLGNACPTLKAKPDAVITENGNRARSSLSKGS